MSQSPKEILFEEEAREKLKTGIDQLAEVVACTLGPKGRNVGLEKSWGAPTITNDGNSIVRDIDLSDQYEDMGVKMAREVASKIKETAGDGTTTGTILLRALVTQGLRYITAGASPINLKRGMEKAVAAIVAEIESRAKTISGPADTLNIATVSASGDSEIGQTIADALERAGAGGVVTIEEGKGTETTLELVEGMQFDRGYLSAYFCTNSEQMTCEISNPSILLVDRKITSIQELLPILQSVATSGKELLIIAEDVEADALATLVVNRLRGTLKVAAVKAPGFGDRRKAVLQDIAILTGATVISEETGMNLRETTTDMLGSAERALLTKDSTTLVNGSGSESEIKGRVSQLRSELEGAASSYDREKLEERIAKLSGGVAVVTVGGATEIEMKGRKQRMEDSLSSTKAALESGTVVGGGVTPLRAAEVVDGLDLSGEEALGASLVRKACEAPARQLAENAGLDGSVVVAEVRAAATSHGFNVLSDQIEDLAKAGVLDPAKVVISTLTHAASTAGIVLLSEALIGEAPEEDE